MLTVNGIDVFYGDLQVLWDVSFQVQKGHGLEVVDIHIMIENYCKGNRVRVDFFHRIGENIRAGDAGDAQEQESGHKTDKHRFPQPSFFHNNPRIERSTSPLHIKSKPVSKSCQTGKEGIPVLMLWQNAKKGGYFLRDD